MARNNLTIHRHDGVVHRLGRDRASEGIDVRQKASGSDCIVAYLVAALPLLSSPHGQLVWTTRRLQVRFGAAKNQYYMLRDPTICHVHAPTRELDEKAEDRARLDSSLSVSETRPTTFVMNVLRLRQYSKHETRLGSMSTAAHGLDVCALHAVQPGKACNVRRCIVAQTRERRRPQRQRWTVAS